MLTTIDYLNIDKLIINTPSPLIMVCPVMRPPEFNAFPSLRWTVLQRIGNRTR